MWNCDWEYQHQDVLKNCYSAAKREILLSCLQAEGLPPHGERSEVKSIMNLYRSGPQCCGPLFSITREVESPCGTAIGSTSTRMF